MKKKKLLLPVLLTAVTVTGLFGGCSCSKPNETPSFTEVSPRPDEVFMTSTPTPEPTKANTPTPSPMPTNTPTPTPEPTATPIPTPVSQVPIDWDDTEAEYVFQVGDNAYFEYYEDSTVLKVTGTGATWDFEWGPRNLLEENERFDMAEILIVEEGITRLGDKISWNCSYVKEVYLPDSLKEVGYYGLAAIGDWIEDGTIPVWHNLNLDKLKVESNSFTWSKGLEDVAGIEQYMGGPTPIPTATPTPTPNPKQPKIMKSFPMGDNVTFEFWDNGYLYVKGSGATWDMSFYFMHASDYENPNWMTQEFLNTITHLIVEEGVTYLGNNSLASLSKLQYAEFPKSLDVTAIVGTGALFPDDINMTGYSNGKKYTFTGTSDFKYEVQTGGYNEATYPLEAVCKIVSGDKIYIEIYKKHEYPYELTWE